MANPQYQLWVLNDNYSKLVHLPNAGSTKTWARLEYRQVLNDVESCTLELVPNATQISSIAVAKRLQVVRDGAVVFAGKIDYVGWDIAETAPEGDTYVLRAMGGAAYAEQRLVVPAAGSEFDERTDHMDDLAKDYVYYHCGAGAAAARQFSDLTVAADANAATAITWQGQYETVLETIQRLADNGGFDWRFVPSTSGFTFTTGYPQYGLDRTDGNGANAECVLSLDRRNIKTASYEMDLMGHRNHIYVLGQGEGADRALEERSDAVAIAAYGRRETLLDHNAELAGAMQEAGDAELARLAANSRLTAQALASTWPTLWGIGDLVTVYIRRYGRTYSEDLKVRAINVIVEGDQEIVEPEFEDA